MGRNATGAPDELAVAAAAEVRAELGRRNLPLSVLDGLIGSHSYVHARLGKTARIALNLNDLVYIEELFGWPPLELMRRAQAVIDGQSPNPGGGHGELQGRYLSAEIPHQSAGTDVGTTLGRRSRRGKRVPPPTLPGA